MSTTETLLLATPEPCDFSGLLEAIWPARARRSDKYSWRLFCLARQAFKNGEYLAAQTLRVFAPQIDFADSRTFRAFDRASFLPGELIIGAFDGEFLAGERLCDVISNAEQLGLSGGCWPSRYAARALEVTAWFWANYRSRGRCLWDAPHQMGMPGDEQRFERIDDTHRRCRWCGQTQRLRTWTETVECHSWDVEA